jgi:hypothetical protein
MICSYNGIIFSLKKKKGNPEFAASLGYTVRHCLKKKKEGKKT